jgi:hypothetical protein
MAATDAAARKRLIEACRDRDRDRDRLLLLSPACGRHRRRPGWSAVFKTGQLAVLTCAVPISREDLGRYSAWFPNSGL